jgi:hypothetical protein
LENTVSAIDRSICGIRSAFASNSSIWSSARALLLPLQVLPISLLGRYISS